MSSIKIFVEGGGATNADGRAELRVAFDMLVNAQKQSARKKRMNWTTVFCGGRDEAASEFAMAAKRGDADIVVLLVDSEDEVSSATPASPTPAERVRHLVTRDPWKDHLAGVAPETVHLMTRCMETWLFADSEKVAEFYGKDFAANALPRRVLLDDEPKTSLRTAIEKSTKDTTKGEYHKVKHAVGLLKVVRSGKIAERCQSFAQFIEWLNAAIQQA